MKKLLSGSVTAAFILTATSLNAITYDANNPQSSLTDSNGTAFFEFDDSSSITKLVLQPNDGARLILDGDELPFAAGAKIIPGQGGESVIANAFSSAGALQFSGVTNMTWQESAFLEIGGEVRFKDVRLDDIMLMPCYGKVGSGDWLGISETTRYQPYSVAQRDGAHYFELQRMSSGTRRSMCIELTQVGDDVVCKFLGSCYKRNESSENLGMPMFAYDSNEITRIEGVIDDKSTGYQKPKILSIGPRSGEASRLTFAVSGGTILPAVSGCGVKVTFDANAFGESKEVLKSGILLNTDDWQMFAVNCELKDIQIKSGRLFGTFLSSAYPEGAEAIAFGWTNNTEFAGCQLQQLDGNLIRTVDLAFRQNGANVEIKWERSIYTRTDASAYYGKKYLTTADSGSATPAVSQIRAHWVSTGFLPATITASGANAMTDSAYVIKGDSRHPVAFNVTARALPQGTLDAYGAVNINVTAAGVYNNGIADKTAITLHDGAALVQLMPYIYSYGHNVLTLDGSEFVASETETTYLNNLVMMNGAKISGGRVNAGYSSSVKWKVDGEGVSTCDANIRLLGNSLNNLRETEINVSDTADGPDFVVNGDIYQNQQANGHNEHGAFVKTGVGTMLMNGTISSIHNNPTRIVEGTLLLGKSGALDPAHNMRLEGGTLALAVNTENAGGAFTVTKNSSLDFGDGATLALAGQIGRAHV